MSRYCVPLVKIDLIFCFLHEIREISFFIATKNENLINFVYSSKPNIDSIGKLKVNTAKLLWVISLESRVAVENVRTIVPLASFVPFVFCFTRKF